VGGRVYEFGAKTISREELVEFTERYDPQQFHQEESGAERSVFDELIASGWHTVCLATRMIVDDVMTVVATWAVAVPTTSGGTARYVPVTRSRGRSKSTRPWRPTRSVAKSPPG
jgi:acyl dehydratase